MSGSICIFGHTDQELSNFLKSKNDTNLRLRYHLKLYWLIEEQINNGIRNFITGVRDGVDILLAAYVLDCRRAMPEKEITLHAVLVRNMNPAMSPAELAVLGYADSYETIADAPIPSGFQQQAQRMISLSSYALVVYFDASGEDAYIYAAARGIPVLAYDPRDIVSAVV